MADTGAQVNLTMGAQNTELEQSSGFVKLNVFDPTTRRCNGFLNEKFYVVNEISKHLPEQRANLLESYLEFEELDPLADPDYGKPGHIDAPIGVNFWVKCLQQCLLKTKDNKVSAQ